MRPPRTLTFILAAFGIVAALGADVHHVPAPAAAHMTMADAGGSIPTAQSFPGVSTVGTFFRSGMSSPHKCTGSVIASRRHDLVLTAGHCVYGTTHGWLFAPGYENGKTPYGVWTVAAAYVSRAWLLHHDDQHDYAILRIQPKQHNGHRQGIQDVTGAHRVALAPRAGDDVTAIAYNGDDNRPVRCTAPAYYHQKYPAFNCHDYRGGSSGSPWLHNGTVVGVIGGLHQGGCTEQTSYSSKFGADIDDLLHRADQEGPGDHVSLPGGNGC